MSADRDTTRIVRSWLEEGVTALPDRVLDTVLDQVPATPQRRSWWPARRSNFMNSYAKLAMAAAAIVVVGIVGYNVLPNIGDPGTRATPTPVATPTANPTAAPTIPPLRSGALQPGRYAESWNGVQISFEVPAGWTGNLPGVDKNIDLDTWVGWGPWLPSVLRPITVVYADACRSAGQLKAVGPTVDDLVQALRAQASTDAVVTDVTIGGLPAKRVEIVQSPGLDRATCRGGADGLIQIWADPGENDFYALGPGTRGIVQIVDVRGVRVVFAGQIGPAASSSDVTELDAIIASTAFAGP